MRTVTTIEEEGQSGVTPDDEYWGENYILKNENQFTTTEYFWDCECETVYIHPKSVLACPRCGACQEERPDSRTNEVFASLMAVPIISE